MYLFYKVVNRRVWLNKANDVLTVFKRKYNIDGLVQFLAQLESSLSLVVAWRTRLSMDLI